MLTEMLKNAIESASKDREIHVGESPEVVIEVPKREGQGDYATTLAMSLASSERRAPREIASILIRHLGDPNEMIGQVEIAGPGFINFTIKPEWWRDQLAEILKTDQAYGTGIMGQGQRIQIEFVSANPTGPLHVGHGRWAAVGNAMAHLLRAVGYEVEAEFYINDAGRQVKLLGESVFSHYQQLFGNSIPIPEDGYRGSYVADLADQMKHRVGSQYANMPLESCLSEFSRFAVDEMLKEIRNDLDAFGIRFDTWFSEAALFERGDVVDVIESLKKGGYQYKRDGAVWFRSTAFSDDKDRVIQKKDGEYTYLASDIAYHRDKLSRGFDRIINIWGADHHGYVARMEAVVQALGYSKEKLTIKIGQLVTLMRSGQPIAMSKRSGEYITVRDVINEVGKDAALFFFLMRRLDSPLEFDLELAKRQTNENPVFYVQYAHARLSSVLQQAEERGIKRRDVSKVDLNRLELPEELGVIRKLCQYPDLVQDAAMALEPHRVTFYLQDLAALLHNYYNHHRFISDDQELTQARLVLVVAVRIVIRNALRLLGIAAPDKM